MAKLKRHKTVKQALEWVVKHPVPDLLPIEMPVWELIARHVFETAHQVGGSNAALKRTATAQKIIFDRLAGKRRTGTHPAQVKAKRELKILDLTKYGSDDE